jgi:hypothetical protein
MDRGLPEFRIEILERDGPFGPALSENFMVPGQPKRLAGFRMKSQLENQFHGLALPPLLERRVGRLAASGL